MINWIKGSLILAWSYTLVRWILCDKMVDGNYWVGLMVAFCLAICIVCEITKEREETNDNE